MKNLNAIAESGVITEREILTIKSRLNRGVDCWQIFDNGNLTITPEQTEKGFNWLWNLYKSPTGKIRKNNPFGNWEISALEDFAGFELVDFVDTGNGFVSWFVPVYRVKSHLSGEFDYYMENGQIVIC